MVPESAVALLFLGFVGTGLLEFFVLRIADALRLFAEPNERSSHVIPTPSVGGLAILLPVVLMLGVSIAAFPAVLWLLLAALLLASLGLIDDLFGLPPWLRLPVQTLACSFALSALLPAAPVWLLLPALLACLWHVNLFNFMDGIDGFAGVQTFSIALGLLVLNPTMTPWAGYLCCVLAGSAVGFLVYNWAPARIFMGDVGSTALGLVLAAMALHLWWLDQLTVAAALILFAGFWFDASYTLIVRALTGQRVVEAHRLHAYQRLARRYGHGPVSLGLLLLNFCWLLPLAAAASRWPFFAAVCGILAIAPLYWVCKNSGAGLPEPGGTATAAQPSVGAGEQRSEQDPE